MSNPITPDLRAAMGPSQHSQNKPVDERFRAIEEKNLNNKSEPVWKSELLKKFDKFGLIEEAEIALVIAAKGTDSVYVVPEFKDIVDCINKLVDEKTKNPMHRFQFVRRSFMGHSFFGEVNIDKTKDQPLVKIFVCDPGYLDKYSFSSSAKRIQNASVEMYITDPSSGMQKGMGCSYFSLNGAFHLRNQEKYEDIYKLPGETNSLSKDGQVNVVPLPARLMRDSQREADIEQLSKSHLIVNKKGQSTSESLKPFIKKEKIAGDRERTLNLRIENKMKTYKEKLRKFISNIQSSDELKSIIKKHNIFGLKAYCYQQTSFEDENVSG